MNRAIARAFILIAVIALMLPIGACNSTSHFLMHDELGLVDLEYENRVLCASEAALASYLSLGYRVPVNISDPDGINSPGRIDIYIRELQEETSGRKVYGSTIVENLKSGYGYIEITDDAGEQLEFTAAHEVFHTVQDAYDAGERKYPWIVEGTAELMAGGVYNATSEYELRNWENGFLNCTEKSLLVRTYDAKLFWVFIAQVYGDSKILEIWQALSDHSINGFDGVEKTLPDFNRDFSDFSEWVYLNCLKKRGVSGYHLNNSSTLLTAGDIDPYGTRYIEISNSAESQERIVSGDLSVNFEKTSRKTIFHIKLLRYRGEVIDQFYEASLSGSTRKRSVEIPDMQNCSKIVLIISRLDRAFSEPANLYFGALEKPALASAAQTDGKVRKSIPGFEISAAILTIAILFSFKKD